MKKKETFYFFIEDNDEKCVVKLIYDFRWKLSIIKGDELYDLVYDFDNKYDFDEVVDWLTQKYNFVQELSKDEICDYIK